MYQLGKILYLFYFGEINFYDPSISGIFFIYFQVFHDCENLVFIALSN